MNALPLTNKSLGQHWLQDEHSLDAIVRAAKIDSQDTVLEIGPGPGTLTAILVRQAKRVIAVEFDQALAKALPSRVPAGNLTVVNQDILQFDLNSLPPDYTVVANIPYYLTSSLLRVLCEARNHFSRAAILIQKEVAERVCAQPGDMSLLSVSVQYYCQVRLGEVIPAYLFTPPPKVDSQIIELLYRQEPLFEDIRTKAFFAIVKAGFAQRRKTLLNSLSAGLHLTKEQATTLLQAAEINPNARAQTLDLQDWYRLCRLYERNRAQK